jgi:hypothetical protein
MKRSLALCALFVVGCSAPPPPEAMPGCNPIIGDDCLTPFPSSFHETDDASTATGVRMNIAANALPQQADGSVIKPDRLNQKDGVSPATPFIVYFKAGVSAASLPTPATLAQSVTATSAVQVIKFSDGTRVPVMAELDVNADVPAGDRQALIIRPMTRLQPATRYIIALVGLKDAAGKPLLPAPFKALRDGTALSKSLMPLASRYGEIFAALKTAGVDRSALTLAWDVTTASDETATSHLTGMVANALALADGGMLGYTITSSTDNPAPNVLRQILATVKTPQYLADDSGKSMLHFAADGKPAQNGLVDTPIVIQIPACAATATGPLPTIVFGHGLFGNAKDTLSSAALEEAANTYCGIFIGTDWIGLASEDVANVTQIISNDLNNVYVVTDRLQQAHVNINTMTRVFLKQIVNDPALAYNGAPITDGKEVYYFGISNGGIQGGTFMGLNPDVVRGVLNVPGCEWTLLMYRSADFNQLKTLLTLTMPDPLDQQNAIASLQSEWDYSDPATFAPHLINDPLPGVPKKNILVQMSIGDAQVSNLATEVLARTMGLQGLDLEQPIYGVAAGTAPLDSAYTQWDSHPMPMPPAGDTALPKDNGAHDSVYQSVLAQQQIFTFMKPAGQVTSVCHGVCSIAQ